jgi:large subunit ribosomal protein L10
MDNPRPEKLAVVEEVRERLDDASASVVTEYRGLTVADLAVLRHSLAAAGGEYKIFKNTLVKRAIHGSDHALLEELLTGPTAIAFVHGDVSAVAKALRDFSRANARLVVKGGLLDGALLSPAQLGALADLPPREVLLAQVAAAIAAPLRQLAGLLEAMPRNLAYGLKALLDQAGGVPAAEVAGAEPPPAESSAAAPPEPAEPPPTESSAAAPPEPAEPPPATEAEPATADAAAGDGAAGPTAGAGDTGAGDLEGGQPA